MIDAQKPDHRSLSNIINWLKEGRFVIPDFQREFEWRPWDISALIRSIFSDYFIGSLLLWKGKNENFDALSCEQIYGFPVSEDGNKDYIVLDGQQRLTALYYAFLAPDVPLPNRSSRGVYFVRIDKFMEGEYDEAFYYDWLSSRIDKVLKVQEKQYEEHIFPVSIIGSGGSWDLANWVQGYEQYWQKKLDDADSSGQRGEKDNFALNLENAKGFSVRLKEITEQYQISYIELDKDLAIDKVCDIFTQINSRGIRLDAFDLINALLVPKNLQLKHMWRKASEKLAFADTPKMNVYVLQVMSILRQNYCSPKFLYYLIPGQTKQVRDKKGVLHKEVLIKTSSDFEHLWNEAVHALEEAIKLLRHPQEFGAIASRYLPYVSILPVFASLQMYVKSIPATRRLNAQRKIRHWYWASVFTNRYSGSIESTSTRDFIDVKLWSQEDDETPPLIEEFRQRFKNLDLRKEERIGHSVYNGIFNLLVLQGARDWMNGNAPQHDDLDDHHIVPASWGAKNLPDSSVHSILNRTPLTAETNRKVIRDRLPNEYLPELISNNGEQTVRDILASHFISEKAQEILLRDPFTAEDFEDFISERQKTLQEAIESLLIKERLDLSPKLRELDKDVEGVEIRLRNYIVEALKNDTQQLPDHVRSKVDQRIQKACKKNPALDLDEFKTLANKIEYFDLRDLQDSIISSVTWETFKDRFVNKESLISKFGQLAELRNGIRHSRTVDDVAKKEGEAAIIWFNQVLDK